MLYYTVDSCYSEFHGTSKTVCPWLKGRVRENIVASEAKEETTMMK